MRKTKWVKAEELKLGDHFINDNLSERIVCEICGALEYDMDAYKDKPIFAYDIARNITVLHEKDDEVLLIL